MKKKQVLIKKDILIKSNGMDIIMYILPRLFKKGIYLPSLYRLQFLKKGIFENS